MKATRDARCTTPDRRAAVLGVWTVSMLLFVSSAQADPVLPSHQGCVTSLPASEGTWTSTQHFQFVASWDPVSGCNPTIHHAMVLHDWFENFDGTGGLKVETVTEWFPECGRIQFDAQSYLGADSDVLDPMGLVSLVYDTGVDCAPEQVLNPTTSPSITSRSVPEPPLIALLGGAVAIACRLRTSRRRQAFRISSPSANITRVVSIRNALQAAAASTPAVCAPGALVRRRHQAPAASLR